MVVDAATREFCDVYGSMNLDEASRAVCDGDTKHREPSDEVPGVQNRSLSSLVISVVHQLARSRVYQFIKNKS